MASAVLLSCICGRRTGSWELTLMRIHSRKQSRNSSIPQRGAGPILKGYDKFCMPIQTGMSYIYNYNTQTHTRREMALGRRIQLQKEEPTASQLLSITCSMYI
ncbi:hypothetical protein BDV36DRAFT_236519 [Aspergillus pseudocaelatus]|uniref:Secreted protein n=1 Tax=Aspergillus pseudocaelatus TaxID=1825620 RepID=A0ABQ6WCC8_9EURO|nr:hypothetical protein BDV36DRAFT_236519 [Aspergillus pseudocaelatus]